MGRDKLDLSGDNKKTSEWFFCANDDSRYQVTLHDYVGRTRKYRKQKNAVRLPVQCRHGGNGSSPAAIARSNRSNQRITRSARSRGPATSGPSGPGNVESRECECDVDAGLGVELIFLVSTAATHSHCRAKRGRHHATGLDWQMKETKEIKYETDNNPPNTDYTKS